MNSLQEIEAEEARLDKLSIRLAVFSLAGVGVALVTAATAVAAALAS